MTSLSSYLKSVPKAAPPSQNFFQKNITTPISDAFSGAVNEVGQGFKEAQTPTTGTPIQQGIQAVGNLFKGGGHIAEGLVSAPAALAAPIIKPTIGVATDAINNSSAMKALSDNPNYQKFANSTAGKVTAGTIGAINTGANILGGVAGEAKAGGIVSDTLGRIKDSISPTDTLNSRIADATPDYNKSMASNGENVKNPEGNIVPRVNEGKGILGKRTVNTSASETQSGTELNNLKNYPDKGTALEKSQAVSKGIGTEAENMRSGLQAEDKSNPLDAAKEKAKVTDLVKSNLPSDIKDALGVLTPEDQQMLKGMSEKAGSPQPEGGKFDFKSPESVKGFFPKTAAGKYYGKVLDALQSYDGTREGKLNLRQTIEKAYQSEGGKYTFGSDSHNALSETNADIRNSLNKDLADTTKSLDTQASLKKQTNLYRAKDVLDTKAGAEETSKVGRFFQNHPLLHRLATREALKTLAQVGGGVALTAYINKILKGQ